MDVEAASFPIADGVNETLVCVAQDSRLWVDVAFAIRSFLAGHDQLRTRNVQDS